MGLLGGFLDDPTTQLAVGLLGGQSPNLGVNIAQAMQFAQAQQKAQEEAKQKRAMLDLQMKQHQLSLEEAQRQQQQGMQDREALYSAPDFGAPPGMSPTVENAANVQRPSEYERAAKMVEYLRSKRASPAAMKPYIDMMEKLRPKGKAEQQLIKMPDGSLGMVNIMDDGTAQILPYTPAEKLREMNLGGSVALSGEYTGKMGPQFQRSLSPDTEFTGGITMRGQNMTDARSRDSLAQAKEIERARLAYDTGLGAGNYNFPTPNVPGMDLSRFSPKERANVAGNLVQASGKDQQAARTALPDVEAQTKETIGLVDKLLAHPGFSTVVGAKGPTGAFAATGYPIPGTDAADFVAIRDQLVGKQFMQAYQTLKGGGQITEVEGKKATDAMARMSVAQSEKAFKEGAADFKAVLQGALARARTKAGGGWSIRALD